MRLDLTINGTDNIQRSFDSLAKSLDALDAKLAKITQGFANASSGANKLAGQVQGAGSGIGGGSAAQPVANTINQLGQAASTAIGPLQRLLVAQQNYQQALATGVNVFDAQYRVAQAQISYNRALTAVNGPSGAQRLSRLVSSTRFGAGGAMPLVGQTGAALGLGAELTTALGLSVAALGAFAAGLNYSIQKVHDWGNFFRKSGGDRQGAEQLAGIAAAAGLDPGQIASIAGELPGGSRQLITKLKAYRSIKDERAARIYAKTNGIEDISGIRDLSDKSFNEAISGKNKFGFSKAEMREAQELQNDWNKTVNRIQRDFVKGMLAIVHAFQWIDDKLQGVGKWTKEHFGINLPGYDSARDKLDKTADKFGEHVDKFGNAVSAAQGTFGGGDRARSAFPAAFGWYGNSQQLMNDSKYLGAFAG